MSHRLKKVLNKKFGLAVFILGLGVFLFLGQRAIGVSANVLPISVSTGSLDFGFVFPGQDLQKYFTVSLANDCQNNQTGKIYYWIVQKIKPLPNAIVPAGFSGTISDYCQANPTDYSRCYRNLCPFLTKTSNDGVTEANAWLDKFDRSDKWKVALDVPDIQGYIAQHSNDGVISQGGDYGCDIGIEMKDPVPPPTCVLSGYKFNDLNKNGIKDSNEPGLANWTIQLKGFDTCKAGEQWADGLISFKQGKRQDGKLIDAIHSNPIAALGPAQNDNNPAHSFGLGFGGKIVLIFNNYILNGAGPDIQLFSMTNNSLTDEHVEVYASQDNNNWTDLGNYGPNASVDLGSLAWAKYLKLVDTSNSKNQPKTADGYDLDAVSALNCAGHLKVIDTKTTDQNGYYCFSDTLANGNYILRENAKAGWTNVTPAVVEINYQGSPQTFNFGNYARTCFKPISCGNDGSDGDCDLNILQKFGDKFQGPSNWDCQGR